MTRAAIVTWAQLLGIMITFSTLNFGAQWGLLRMHAEQPHRDAVTVRELNNLHAEIREIRLALATRPRCATARLGGRAK